MKWIGIRNGRVVRVASPPMRLCVSSERTACKDLVDRCCQMPADLVTGIGSLPGAEVLWEPTINQGLVRFLGFEARRDGGRSRPENR